jgi:ribosome-associated heat shock protein Hsp15
LAFRSDPAWTRLAPLNAAENQTGTPGCAPAPAAVRLDKWLWAVRLFKTRGLATQACTAGHVKIQGARVKPAHTVRPGEVIEVQFPDGWLRRVKVLGLLDRRVGARLVPQYLEDLSPPRPPAAAPAPALEPLLHRPKGSGRPTKRDRRQLRRLGLLPPED